MAKEVKSQTTLNALESVIHDSDVEVTAQWAIDFLRQSALTRQNFVDKNLLDKYRNIDKGVWDSIDLQKLKNYFDPKDVNTGIGGDAEYMRTDWAMCPLIQSLLNIVKKQIKEAVAEVAIKGSDKLSVDKKAAEKLRVLNRRNMIDNMNMVLAITGQPPMDYDTNVEKVIASFEKKEGGEDSSPADVPSIIDMIKNEVENDFDYQALAESGMLKDGVEISHEEMISHYMEHSKYEDLISEKVISDYMKVNSCVYRWYTSAINGLPECTYVNPESIYTSPFQNKDGSDMVYWHYTFIVTWSEYMKMCGGAQTPEQNKRVWEANRTTFLHNSSSVPNYDAAMLNPTFGFWNTNIQLGYMELRKHVHNESTEKYYDVVKKFYYLPTALFTVSGSEGSQEDFIMELGDLQDMYRHGSNLQYADFSIILRRDKTKMSFYDVMSVEFDRINKVYAQYLNTFAAFIPEGTIFAAEPLMELAKGIIAEMADSDNKELDDNAQSAIVAKVVRRMKQSGTIVMPKRKGDNDEEQMDKLTSILENKILLNCGQLIQQLMTLYNLMLMSLGINPNRLAQEPKPRTTNKSIQGATASSQFATLDLEEAASYMKKEFAKRMLYYDQQVITEFDKNLKPVSDRAKEMAAIIGVKGINWLEVYNDMPVQRCILKVVEAYDENAKMLLVNYASGLELNGKLPIGTVPVLLSIENNKLANLFVISSVKRQARLMAENQQALMAQQAQNQQALLQQQAKQESDAIDHQARVQAALTSQNNQEKTQGQLEVKTATLESRKEEKTHEHDLEVQDKQQESLA